MARINSSTESTQTATALKLSSSKVKRIVAEIYQEAGAPLDNATMMQEVSRRTGIPYAEIRRAAPVGKRQVAHKLGERALRWHQQSLRAQGHLQRVPNKRGLWTVTEHAKQRLHLITPGKVLLGFSTELGVAFWADCRTLFADWNEPIDCVLTSPPYPLAKTRAFGAPKENEYVDFICGCLEPMVKWLKPGAAVALNLTNDIFNASLPSRSLYLERLTIALHDRLGLSLMDRTIWVNPSKPPGPVQWASKSRQQLNVSWEPVLVLSNDAKNFKGNNRRVLEAHTARQLKLFDRQGEQRERINSDGAYRIVSGAYGKRTAGKIPRNVITMGHACRNQQEYKLRAREAGLPAHAAPFPVALAAFFLQWLTEENDLVIDPFGGSMTTGVAAQALRRRWVCADSVLEYIQGAALRFDMMADFEGGAALDVRPVASPSYK